MSTIGVIQCIHSKDFGSDAINQALYEFHAVQYKDNTKLLPYVVFPGDSVYTWIYSIYCAVFVGGSYIVVIVIMIKILSVLKANKIYMSDRTVKLHRQINTVMLIQVSKNLEFVNNN